MSNRKIFPDMTKPTSRSLTGCVLALACMGPTAVAQPAHSNAQASETPQVLPPPVSEIPDGYMMIDGDIVVPVDYFDQRAGGYGDQLWPNGVVPFEFDGNVSQANRSQALAAMALWEAAANVDFVSRDGEWDFLHIQSATFNASEGVGRAGGQHDIWITNWNNQFVIAHEFGHALGFWHEQSRLDRDSFVQIEFDNVSQIQCGGGPCDPQFDYRTGGGGDYGPYDFDSVMHYGACFFSACASCSVSDPGCRTITVLPPWDTAWQSNIGQRTHLSTFDMRVMSFLYPFGGWRFIDRDDTGADDGTFLEPYQGLSDAVDRIPSGGTLWFLEPDAYSAVGTYSKSMTLRAGYGVVTLGS